jgi:hypothetical protein
LTTSSIRLRGVVGALLVSLALAGCGGPTATTPPPIAAATPAATPVAATAPSPSPSPETSSPAPSDGGFPTTGRIEVAAKGFALTLPGGWTRVDLSDGDLDAITAAAGELDPALAQRYAAQIRVMLAAGLAIFAFGPDPRSGSYLTVLVQPGGGLSLDLLAQLNAGQFEGLDEVDVETERVTLPAGEAIHYHYTIAGGAGPASALDTYLLLAGEDQLALTIAEGSAGEVASIADSIEVLD